jgi:hypothetical protein
MEDEEEEDLSARRWLKKFSKIFGYIILLWWMYCMLNI